jgi:hypothetical protein
VDVDSDGVDTTFANDWVSAVKVPVLAKIVEIKQENEVRQENNLSFYANILLAV